MQLEDLEQFFKTIKINNRITNEIKDWGGGTPNAISLKYIEKVTWLL